MGAELKKINQECIGSSFEDFLQEEGIYDEVTDTAIKRVLAWQLKQEMEAQKVSKAALARRMKTSRSSVDRLLDPRNNAATLACIDRAAKALGKSVRLELVDE